MFSLDSLLQDAFPHRNTPAWQRSLLRTLLRKEFKQFAADYPHLKGLDLIEQVVDYFNLSCELVDGDLENIPSQGPVVLVANRDRLARRPGAAACRRGGAPGCESGGQPAADLHRTAAQPVRAGG